MGIQRAIDREFLTPARKLDHDAGLHCHRLPSSQYQRAVDAIKNGRLERDAILNGSIEEQQARCSVTRVVTQIQIAVDRNQAVLCSVIAESIVRQGEIGGPHV